MMNDSPPANPRILVCYERGDADAQAARLVEDLRRLSSFDNVATWYDYGPQYFAHLLSCRWQPLLIIAVAGPAIGRPRQTETPEYQDLVARLGSIQFAVREWDRQVATLLVGGAAEIFARLPPEQQRLLDARYPPIEIRDEHWREDLDERLIRHLWPGWLPPPADEAGRGEPYRPTADELEQQTIRYYERLRAEQQSAMRVAKEYKGDQMLAERWEKASESGGASPRFGGGTGGATSFEATGGGGAAPVEDESPPEADPPIILSGGDEERPAPPTPAPASPVPAPSPRGAAPAPPASDVVECTVFAPPEVRPESSFLVQVFAHLTHEDAAVALLAKEADEEAEKRGSKSLDAEVARGSRLTFHLRLPGMQVDEPAQHLTWRGEPEAVQFGVTAGARVGGVIGTVTVSQNEVPFGHVKFKLTVSAGGGEPAADGLGDEGRAAQSWARYRKAFISYASDDRDEVLKRVQMLARLKIDFFQDILTLEPGERWERELYRHIDDSDVFFLFWSKAARDSEWVLREIRYALGRRGADEFKPPEIVPVIIEGPPLVEPPKELADLHFNDPILYFLDRAGRAP